MFSKVSASLAASPSKDWGQAWWEKHTNDEIYIFLYPKFLKAKFFKKTTINSKYFICETWENREDEEDIW